MEHCTTFHVDDNSYFDLRNVVVVIRAHCGRKGAWTKSFLQMNVSIIHVIFTLFNYTFVLSHNKMHNNHYTNKCKQKSCKCHNTKVKYNVNMKLAIDVVHT